MRFQVRQSACGWLPALRWSAIALVLLGLLVPALASAVYEKIRVPYPVGRQPAELFFHPDLELMDDDDGAYILLSRPELTAGLRARGFEVEVLIPDLEAYYVARQGNDRDYGIWHTYSEMVTEIDALHAQYPNLTTAKSSIATTGEGRTVWAMKISDNPNVQENEPEVLFDGMIHAREIMTVEGILHYMHYLCDNYGTDPVITFLVNNRQIWFVPILNVDGFVYNEQTNPNGGGLWRKNRRDNGVPGCEGVDCNRNYPFQWVGDGSSPDPCDETYRGPSARSEPEIIGITAFINAHHFIDWQSYHSVAALVLFPWGYTSAHTLDDALFRGSANVMASVSGYAIGQPIELLYPVNGGSIDWGYGATVEHQKIFAFTTEFGGSDFWPQPAERDGLIAENLYSNIFFCEVAGVFAQATAFSVTGGDGNGRLDAGENASIQVTVTNPSFYFGASNVRVTLISEDPYVTVTDAQWTAGNLAINTSATNTADLFDVSVAPGAPAGRSAKFRIIVDAEGGFHLEESRSLAIGLLPVLFSNDFEASSDWIQDPSHNATTGAFVRVDPIGTAYQPEDDTTPAPGVNAWITAQNPGHNDLVDDVDSGTSATRSPVYDLSGVTHARLSMRYFFGQRDSGDDAGDGLRIDLSNNNGGSWVNLVTIGDVNYEASWRTLEVNLEDYAPLTAQMLIRIQASDPGGSGGTGDVVETGIDDLSIQNTGDGNQPPPAPNRIAPADGSQQISTPTLIVQNVVDPEGQPVTYGFRVYSDAALTQVVASVDGIPQGEGGQTEWSVPALANATFYWRAFAADPTLLGSFSTVGSFHVQDGASVPDGVAGAVALSAGPNPAAGEVTLRYYSPSAVYAKIQIFDATGRRMRQLEGPRWSEGWQEVRWDGRDSAGQRVPAGVYYVRLALPTETRTVRVVQMQ